jgi:hypothetical protein
MHPFLSSSIYSLKEKENANILYFFKLEPTPLLLEEKGKGDEVVIDTAPKGDEVVIKKQ